MVGSRRNILLVVSDQERQRDWLPPSVRLPAREQLMSEGIEFKNYWTHSSPCSPSRATMMTGRYLPQHGVVDNVINRIHRELDPAIPTVGKLLTSHGYRSSYVGKWHLSYGSTPDMEAYGYRDWQGDDRKFMGWAGTGVYFDPVIANQAADWLRTTAPRLDGPWFLTVGLVNPHDVMWFPIDQPSYQEEHPEEVAFVRRFLEAARWKDGETLPAFDEPYEEVFDELPPNFDDDLHTKPEAQRQWRYDQQHGIWGHIDPADKGAWLRQLDYYVKLHLMADQSLGTVLSALEESGCAPETAVLFTSDHGDMCGSHGLRSKGPFAYNEIMKVPLYARVPGVTRPGTVTDSLGCHADLLPTIMGLAGAPPHPGVPGVDLGPILAEPTARVRDHVLFAQDSAHTRGVQRTRYALRGVFDGRYKYVRYYGVGGGIPSDQLEAAASKKLFDVDSDFDDQDHELYDLAEDPLELENLANDRGRREELRRWFSDLRSLEELEMRVGATA